MKFESSVNKEEVDQIVETMKRKYRTEGMEFEEVSGGLKELRGIIEEDTYARADIINKEDLEAFNSNLAQQVGAFYLKMKKYLTPIKEGLKKFPLSNETGYYLYSANMNYSSNQYLALTSAAGLIALLFGFIAGLFLGIIFATTTKNYALATTIPLILAPITALVTIVFVLNIPRQKANARGAACTAELPFALRHMATELRAGLGLYKTIQAVTAANYGVLSEEFARSITEIEEGTETSVALKHLALRTQSKPLKSALNHMLRAMRVGGNLSDIMNEIAEEVSDDLKNRINTFSQEMNFFAVIFIFVCIVMPTAILILGAIRNSATSGGKELFRSVPLTPEIMIIFYLIIMPIIFIVLNYFIYISQPKM
jgi:pilus assembly protein TadC